MIFVRPQAAPLFNDTDVLRRAVALEGNVYRSVPGRKTVRIDVPGGSFFFKVHHGIGWKEIIKNVFQFKTPIFDAGNEWRAIQKLGEIGVPTVTVTAYGMRRRNPARRQSFIMTDALHNSIDLESFCRNVFRGASDKDKIKLKRILIHKVASISRRIHQNGINHQDFYLVHFLLKSGLPDGCDFSEQDDILLFDLHRAQIRRKIRARAAAKDLAGVFFSSLDVVPLTRRDLFRFIREYRQKGLRDVFLEEGRFWQRVEKRARKIYRKVHGKDSAAAVFKRQ